MLLVETNPLLLSSEESESVDSAISLEALSALAFSSVVNLELLLSYTQD